MVANRSIEALHSFEAVYQNEILKRLQNEDMDSPLTAAFHEWVRGLMRLKLPRDIEKDNLNHYLMIVFLCQHSLIFNLIFHNRFDLLKQLLSEFEHTTHAHGHSMGRDDKKLPIPPIIINAQTVSTITTAQIEEIFKHLEDINTSKQGLNAG